MLMNFGVKDKREKNGGYPSTIWNLPIPGGKYVKCVCWQNKNPVSVELFHDLLRITETRRFTGTIVAGKKLYKLYSGTLLKRGA